MTSSSRKIVLGTAVFIGTVLVAVFGYWLAGWSLLEAFYMVIITIYGVGYGEVRPVDEPGLRLFTMLFIVSGCTSAVFVMGGFVQMIAEGELNKALGARKMNEGIKRLQQHAIICGFGRVGQILAHELHENDIHFVVVDSNRQRLEEAENLGYLVYTGDATEESTLEAVGIAHAKVLATVLPNDALNVFITLSARELNEEIEIIARGESASTRRKLLRSGATEVVMPAAVGATKIAQLISRPSASKLLESEEFETRINEELEHLGIRLQEVEIQPGSALAGLKLKEIEQRIDRGVVVVSIKNSKGEISIQPNKETILNSGDTITIVAHPESLQLFKRHNKSKEMIYRGAKLS